MYSNKRFFASKVNLDVIREVTGNSVMALVISHLIFFLSGLTRALEGDSALFSLSHQANTMKLPRCFIFSSGIEGMVFFAFDNYSNIIIQKKITILR